MKRIIIGMLFVFFMQIAVVASAEEVPEEVLEIIQEADDMFKNDRKSLQIFPAISNLPLPLAVVSYVGQTKKGTGFLFDVIGVYKEEMAAYPAPDIDYVITMWWWKDGEKFYWKNPEPKVFIELPNDQKTKSGFKI